MTLENVVDIIVEKFRPYSIFLYGSKATKSDNNWSDCEIGVIFADGKYVSRKEIVDSINDTNYSILPFKLISIINILYYLIYLSPTIFVSLAVF